MQATMRHTEQGSIRLEPQKSCSRLSLQAGFIPVKLLSEHDEHHLPDAPHTMQPWYIRMLRRGMTLLLSTTGITIAIGILLTFILTGIISLNYLDIASGIDKNGISQTDFYASFRMEIPDTEATQRKIDRTKQTLAPIYQEALPHNRDITTALHKLLDSLGSLITNTDLSVAEKYARFQQWVGNRPNADLIFDRYFKQPLSTTAWEQVSESSQKTMQILAMGFTEADEQLKRRVTIERNIPRGGYPAEYRELVYFLVDATLEPNLILDEITMKRRQEEVAAQIAQQPEIHVFSKGEKIVGKGERVSPVAMAALNKMGKTSGRSTWIPCLGVFLLTMLFVFTLWSYLYNFKERQFFKPSYALLISLLTIITTVFFHLQDTGAFGDIPVFAFPLATIALTIAIFMHPHISVLTTTLLVFLMALTLRAEFRSMAILLFGSYMGIYILSKRITYSERGHLMYAGFYVGATNALILMALSLIKPAFIGASLMSSNINVLGWGVFSLRMLAWSFFSGVFSGVLTIGSMPLLEALFRLITPYTLMELGNHDQPLLKRMQFEAPGTFHHSLMVATLAEAAAESIGANALLTRVGCLYHDIGKMKRPLFFIENQAYFGVENPHDKLTPRLSKMVITAHPRDSIEMAKQHKLPEILMKFMTEHHGTLTAGYFYNKACIEEGVENVNKSQFRYPGPKPGSKETAIVMLADACESAVRALKTPTVAQVEERIDKIIQQRIEDGQFDNCPITFQDIYQIKQTFVRVLRGIQHNRIEYQQNIMRELGRKLPTTTIQDHAGLQDTLKQIQGKSDKGAPQSQDG
jgi:cyclic-di-AMP phosphodiesterase PgpH